MSVSLFVVLALDSQPNTSQINEYAKELEHEIVYEESIALPQHSGFLPATFSGENAGFELFVYPTSEVDAEIASILPEDKSDGMVYELSIGGNPLELQAAVLTAIILSSKYNGVIFDMETAQLVPENQLQDMVSMFGQF